jgi:anti-sigma regulatory factor (Ser/Thr protein kinase)
MISMSDRLHKRETMPPATLELELKRDLGAPAIARAAASGRCDDMDLSPSLCHTLLLLVSEVVSNAVLHSSAPRDAPIVFTTSITEDVIRVTVTDKGSGFSPRPRDPETSHGGYGLYLLEKAAHRWGVDHVGGTRVWFELSRALNET